MADTVAAQVKGKLEDGKSVGKAAINAALEEMKKKNGRLASRISTATENAGRAGAEIGRTVAGAGSAFSLGVIEGYVAPDKAKYVRYVQGGIALVGKGYALAQVFDGQDHMGVHIANGVGDGALFGLTAALGKDAGTAWKGKAADAPAPAAAPTAPPAPNTQGDDYEGYTDYTDGTAEGDEYEGEDAFDVTPAAEGPEERQERQERRRRRRAARRQGGQGGQGGQGQGGQGGQRQGGRGGQRQGGRRGQGMQQIHQMDEQQPEFETAPPMPVEEE